MTTNQNDTENPEQNEQNESAEEQNRRAESKKSQFIKKFIGFHYNKRDGGGTEFLNKISTGGKITSDMKKLLQSYAKGITEFEGVNLSDIKYSELMGEVTTKLVSLNNNRNEFKTRVLREYDISSSKYSNDIINRVEELDEDKLKQMLESDILTTDFLKVTLGKKPDKKDLLSHLGDFNLKNRYKNLNEESKETLAFFFNKIDNNYKLSIVDFQDLFDTGVFSDKEKLDFIRQFIPVISLSEAIKIGLINPRDAKKYRLEVIKEGLASDDNLSEDDVNLSRVLRSIRDENIMMDIDRVVKNSKDATKLMDSDSIVIKTIRDDFNNTIEKVKNSEESNLSKDFKGFKEALGKSSKIDGASLEKFQKGNIVALSERSVVAGEESSYSKTDPEDTIKYFEIANEGKINGKIKLLKRGEGAYDDSVVDSFEITYDKFLSLINDGLKDTNDYGEDTKKVSISKVTSYLKSEIAQKISEGKIIENNDKLRSINVDELTEERQKLKNKLKIQLEAEIDENGNKKWTKDQIQEKLDNDDRIKELAEEIESSGSLNIESLKKKIDDADTNGKDFGFGKGVTFEVGQGKESTIYTVTGVDGGKVSIEYMGNIEELTYQDFYSTFKEKRAKRTSNVHTDFSNLVSSVGDDKKIGTYWKNFKFNNGKIHKKEGAEGKNIDYPYLASIDGKQMLKIKSIDGEKVTFYNGEIKTQFLIDEKTGEKEKKGEEYSLDKTHSYTVSLGWLDTYIKSNKLRPRNFKQEGVDRKEEKIKEIEGIKGSFVSRLFKNYSIAEVIAGSKQGIEAFENFLKEGNDYNSAKFAEGVFGKLLPAEVRKDLKTRVEAEEKKHQDDYVQKLKDVDSSDATEMIVGWLKNTDSPEYKKEAGVVFMLEKYGALYAKSGLKEYKGTYLFYKALGGSVEPPDKLFLEVKQQQEDSDLPMNEEHLVYRLLNLQCRGKLRPHRRSRLHKDIKRFRATGKEEEIETGLRDSKDERTIENRIFGGMGELKGGTYPNAIGWAENVINKGGSMQDMNKIPFVMAFSGIAYNFDHVKILDALKNFNAKGLLNPVTRFMSHTSDLEMLNSTILELSHRIEARSSNYVGIGKAAQSIFDQRKDIPPVDEKKINQTEAFFDKYGEIITRSLFMLNDGKTDSDSHLSKLIFFEKDDGYTDEKGETRKGNEKFKAYYDRFRDLIDGDTKWDNTDTMEDAFRYAGTSGFHMQNATKNIKQDSSGGFRLGNTGTYMWEEISDEFDAILNRNYEEFGEGAREKLLEDNLRQFLSTIIELHSSREELLKALMKKTSVIGSKLRYWGIDLKALSLATDYRSILSDKNTKADTMVKGYVNNILSKMDNSSLAASSDGGMSDYSKMETVIDTTKKVANNAVYEEQRRRA